MGLSLDLSPQQDLLDSPGLLHSDVAVELLQSVLSCVVVHDEDALFHVRPLRALENCNRST